jgi:hypothetical protein
MWWTGAVTCRSEEINAASPVCRELMPQEHKRRETAMLTGWLDYSSTTRFSIQNTEHNAPGLWNPYRRSLRFMYRVPTFITTLFWRDTYTSQTWTHTQKPKLGTVVVVVTNKHNKRSEVNACALACLATWSPTPSKEHGFSVSKQVLNISALLKYD